MREPTDAEVEAVGRALYGEYIERPDIVRESAREGPLPYYKPAWVKLARAAIIALDEVRGK